MTTDAGSGFDDQAASRDAGTNLDDVVEESRHLPDDEAGQAVGDEAVETPGEDEEPDDEAYERRHSHDSVNDAF